MHNHYYIVQITHGNTLVLRSLFVILGKKYCTNILQNIYFVIGTSGYFTQVMLNKIIGLHSNCTISIIQVIHKCHESISTCPSDIAN